MASSFACFQRIPSPHRREALATGVVQGTIPSLLEAIRADDAAAFRALLGLHPALLQCNVDESGNTLMHMCATCGRPGMVELLAQQGANVNATNRVGATPLHHAAANCHVSVVRALGIAGCDPNPPDVRGHTPMHEADVQRPLNPTDACDAQTAELVETLRRIGASCWALNRGKQTPLHLAAKRGNTAAIRALVLQGAVLNRPDVSAATPLHLAAEAGQAAAVAVLIELGADLEARDKHKRTALRTAVFRTDAAVVARLLGAGCNPSCRDKRNAEPLGIAARLNKSGVGPVLDQLLLVLNAQEIPDLELDSCFKRGSHIATLLLAERRFVAPLTSLCRSIIRSQMLGPHGEVRLRALQELPVPRQCVHLLMYNEDLTSLAERGDSDDSGSDTNSDMSGT